jgi:predicted amidohydrolase YtcJ
LPRDALRELLLEAARNEIRVATIWPDVVDLFAEVHRSVPIDDQRWVQGHISLLDENRIRLVRELGLVLTTHTNRHILKDGGRHLDRLGPEAARTVVPLRSLLEAGVPLSFGSDNMPPSLFGPIHHAVARRAAPCGRIVAPEERLTRFEALRIASYGGAYLSLRETEIGTLEAGKLADLVVLPGDFSTIPENDIPVLTADLTMVDGRIVHDRVGREGKSSS